VLTNDRTSLVGVWVCGTDTGVGKTAVSAGLVRALSLLGCRVVGLKPVVSGSLTGGSVGEETLGLAGDDCWEDLLRLSLAGGVPLPDAQRAAVRLHQPVAPRFAALTEGVAMDPMQIVRSVQQAGSLAEFAVVEGVGGLRVPLAQGYDTADLAHDLDLPAVLVVGLRLGCINHALLTGEALSSRGIRLAGWVANGGIDPAYGWKDETIAAIEEGLGVACSARLGRLATGRILDREGPDAAWLAEVESQCAAAAVALGELAASLWRHGESAG